LDGSPQDFQVNAKVLVNKLITHRHHFLLGYLRVATTFVCRDVPGSLTDYFQCPDYGEVCSSV
jgi:hypothetical protein